MVEHTCNASAWETEVGGLLVQGQLGLYTLFQKKKKEFQVNKRRNSSCLSKSGVHNTVCFMEILQIIVNLL
jgi:hypothetical protein